MREEAVHPMERVAIFASIILAAVMLRTWIVVERASESFRRPTIEHAQTAPILYRAEWTDEHGILRTVETRGETTDEAIEQHRADIARLAAIFPPR